MRDNLFRKDPKKKILSPHKTDQMIVQPRLSTWLVLAGLLVIIVALFFGLLNITLITTVDGNGIVISNTSRATVSPLSEPEVFLFIPFTRGQQVHPGMTVQVSPLSLGRDEYMYFEGTVTGITPWPVTRDEVSAQLNNNSELADYYLSRMNEPPRIARVRLNTVPGHPELLVKSGQFPDTFVLHPATPCQGRIIVSQKKIYEKFFPWL